MMDRRLGTRTARAGVRAVCAITVVVSGGCASAGTLAPAYQITTHTDARPPLAPPVAAVLAPSANAGGASGPPSLPPAQSTIVGMPSIHVNVSANGNDVAEVIAGVARQVGLRAVIDPGIHGPITTTMQNVSVNDAIMRLVGSRYQFRVQNGALVVSPIQLVQQTYEVSYLQMARSSQASTVVARNLTGASNSGIITNPSGAGTGVSNTSSGLVASGTDVIQSSSNSDVWGELKVGLRTILFSGRTDSSGRTGPNAGSSAIGGASASGDCYEGTCLNISPFANLVTVTATPEKQQLVADWLNLFKASITRQVYITAKVVEVTLDRSKSYGIDWQAVLTTAKAKLSLTTELSAFPTAAQVLIDPTRDISSTNNASFNLGVGDLGLKAVINALQSTGDVNVLASPSTAAMNQQKASFNVTREIPFLTTTLQPVTNQLTGQVTYNQIQTVQTQQVGIILDVLPQIASDNVVTMSIRPSVTSLVSTQTIVSSGGLQSILPTTDRRETDTMARVRSGETIMIGGLIQTQTTSDRHGIPVLMNLPGLGHLFSHVSTTEHHSEMVIFITPQIVSGQPPGAP
jgi:MSHA biogenesis protein MshL